MKFGLYCLSFVIGFVAAVIINLHICKKTDGDRRVCVTDTLTGFISGILGAVIMATIYNFAHAAAGITVTQSRASLYGGLLFMPLFMLIPAKITKRKLSDILDPCCAGVYALLGVAKTGCFAYGCCYGIECNFGFYNDIAGVRVFPVQLLEAVLTLVLALFIANTAVKQKLPHGGVYLLGLMIYTCIRFFIQFLRFHESEAEKHFFLWLDLWQTVSLIAFSAAFIYFFILLHKQKQTVNEQ